MPWKLAYSPDFERWLAKLDRNTQIQITTRLEWFAANFDFIPHEQLHGKWREHNKFRIGDYRAAYRVDRPTRTLYIDLVDRRDKVYKPKKRK